MPEPGQLYVREPLRFENDIPVFSQVNAYTENYETISADHLAAMQKTGENPFIREKLWTQFEDSTLALVQKYARRGDAILDVGVGLGRVLEQLPHLRRFGVDISMGYLAVAQAKGIDVCYALIEELPYGPELFDIVICTDVLEHVLDLNLCCKNILSTLKPNGTLVVRVPFREELWPYLEESYPYHYVHVRNFDEYSLRLLFERILECRVLEMTTVGYQSSSVRLRYPLPIPGWSAITDSSMSLLEKRRPQLHAMLLPRLYRPIAVNAAIAKI